MERREFLKKSMVAAGGVIVGSSVVGRLIVSNTSKDTAVPLPRHIETIHQGKGKNVLVLMGSGTRLGNTDRLTDAFIKGLMRNDHTITKVYLGEMKLKGCRGCGICQRHQNVCVIRDEMQDIYPLFDKCDIVVFASPLYFWTITSCIKAFIERLYAISREDQYPTKGTILLMTAGDDYKDTFSQPLQYYRIISGVLGDKDLGHYCAGGCMGCENVVHRIAPKHLDNAFQLGVSIK